MYKEERLSRVNDNNPAGPTLVQALGIAKPETEQSRNWSLSNISSLQSMVAQHPSKTQLWYHSSAPKPLRASHFLKLEGQIDLVTRYSLTASSSLPIGPLCSLNTQSTFLPQGLCTCCFLCLEHSSLPGRRVSPSLPPALLRCHFFSEACPDDSV